MVTASQPEEPIPSGLQVIRTPLESDVRELDRRSAGGVDVLLVWGPRTNAVSVVVVDQRTGVQFRVEVDPAHALEAFYDPFSYESDRAHAECVVA